MRPRFNIGELREAARQGDYFLNAETMTALLEAVEAARLYRLRHAVESPNEGQKFARDRLDDALARFRFPPRETP